LTEEEMQILFEEVVQKIEEQPVLFCSFCNRFMFTTRQTFMHIACPDHIAEMTNVSKGCLQANSLLIAMVGKTRVEQMFEQDTERVNYQRQKWSAMSIDEKGLFPPRTFIEDVNKKYFEDRKISNVKDAKKIATAFLENPNYSTITTALTLHIGNAKVR
ncbi:hypothetical protein PMAYCL1PPCAC_01185, partial [Pristionchus mayeri]